MTQENITNRTPWSPVWLATVVVTLFVIGVLISTNGQLVRCWDIARIKAKAVAGEPRAISEMASCSTESTEVRYWLRYGSIKYPNVFGSHLALFYLKHPTINDADRKADLSALSASGDHATQALARDALESK